MPLSTPASNAVYRPGGSVAAIPDSRLFVGARPAAVNSAAWVGSSCQSLFATRSAPLLSRSSKVGLASALGTPNAVRLGPIPRTTIRSFAAAVSKNETGDHDVAAVPTEARVLMLASFAMTV